MHQNDRWLLSQVFSNVDPVSIPLYESLLIGDHSLRKEVASARDELCAWVSEHSRYARAAGNIRVVTR